MSKKYNEVGNRYGRLVVISQLEERSKKKSIQWLCKCDCGNTTIAITERLHSGDKLSCGCLNIENLKRKNTIHGMSGKRIYNEWLSIKARCYNKNTKSYARYGGRGITMCDEWKNNFEVFQKWAYESGYTDNLTIERKNVNGNYCPDNCCWITSKEQAKNRRSTLRIKDENGNERYAMDVAKELGIPMSLVIARKSNGWSLEKALYTPIIEQTIRKKVVQYTMNGEYIASFNSIGEANRITGVERSSISRCCLGQRNHAGGYLWKYKEV